MKKTILTLSLILSQLTFAQELKSDPLNDRIELTEAAIRSSVEDFRNTQESSVHEYADFDAHIRVFNAQVEKELINYQNAYKEEVLNPIRKKISDYNKIKKSSAYSTDDKEVLLAELYNALKTDVYQRSSNVQSIWIEKLVELMGAQSIYFEDGKTITDQQRFQSANPHLQGFSYNYPLRHLLFKNCFSRGCQSLLFNTYSKYIQLLQKLNAGFSYDLDIRDPSIPQSQSNRRLQFQASSISFYTMMKHFESAFAFLAGTKPFFLYQNESSTIQEILQTVNSSSDIEECKSEVSKLKKDLCSSQKELCEYFEYPNTLVEMNLGLSLTTKIFPKDEATLKKIEEALKVSDAEVEKLKYQVDVMTNSTRWTFKEIQKQKAKLAKAIEQNTELNKQKTEIVVKRNSCLRTKP